jgi:hypothetical protein
MAVWPETKRCEIGPIPGADIGNLQVYGAIDVNLWF